MTNEYFVNPQEITNFKRTDDELCAFFIFVPCVAGKNAKMISLKVRDFLTDVRQLWHTIYITDRYTNILDCIRDISNHLLLELLKKHKMGKYTLLMNFFKQVKENRVGLQELKQAGIPFFEKLPGYGFKSSRFFILHSRKVSPFDVVVLDTHILKYLKVYVSDYRNISKKTENLKIPKATPSSKKLYETLTQLFIESYNYFKNKGFKGSLADFDLLIWKYYNNKINSSLSEWLLCQS